MQPTREQLQRNILGVRQEVAEACTRFGRDPDSVRVVTVTKYVESETASRLVGLGQLDLGENRPQQLDEKARSIGDHGIRWHMIGHLQRNKVRLVVPRCHLIHSVDSPRLLESIHECASGLGTVARCLLEINISGDESKHGLRESEVMPLLELADGLSSVEIQGLMAMSGLDSTPDESLRQFEAVRELRDRLASQCGDRFRLTELSMGMSGDFLQAIQAGATLLRIGSRFFERD